MSQAETGKLNTSPDEDSSSYSSNSNDFSYSYPPYPASSCSDFSYPYPTKPAAMKRSGGLLCFALSWGHNSALFDTPVDSSIDFHRSGGQP